jgi:hypothetical protein
MVWDQCPGIAGGVRLGHDLTQPFQKVIPVMIVQENGSSCDSSTDDMVQSTGCVYS